MFADSKKTVAKTAACLTTVLFAIAAPPATAQNDAQADTNAKLLACGNITNPQERMDCFNALVEDVSENAAASLPEPMPASRPEPSAAPADDVSAETPLAEAPVTAAVPATPAPAAAATPAPAADPVTAATAETNVAATAPAQPARPAAAAAPERASSPAVAAGASASSARTAEPAASATTATASPASATDVQEQAIANFGLGDVEAKAAEERRRNLPEIDTLHATIVEAWETIDGRFEVRLDNGQVWRETQRTRTTRFPKAGTPVRITTGSLGSFNMKFGNDNRLAGVRRTE